MITREDLRVLVEHNISYHAPTELAVRRHELIRTLAEEFALAMINICPVTDELIKGLGTLTDEVVPLFNAAVARHHDELE